MIDISSRNIAIYILGKVKVNKNIGTMTKTLKEKLEAQYKQKLRALIGSVTHTQNIADQALALAKGLMTETEQADSDACRVIENVSCVCEEALQVLCEELQRGTRLYERLCDENVSPSLNTFNHGREK